MDFTGAMGSAPVFSTSQLPSDPVIMDRVFSPQRKANGHRIFGKQAVVRGTPTPVPPPEGGKKNQLDALNIVRL